MRSEQAWVSLFTDIKAFWVHDGNPENPHACLTSGNHSNGYFNYAVTKRAELLPDMCLDLVDGIPALKVSPPDIVIGCGESVSLVANKIGGLLRTRSGFSKKIIENDVEKMVLKCSVSTGMNVLLVDDVFTTGKTLRNTIAAVRSNGASVVETSLVFLNRSNINDFDGQHIFALINHPMNTWKPDECPLCQSGSMALRPRDNWKKLTCTK